MKTLVIFYSYSGKTKALATEYAKKESFDITEIEDVRRPCKLKAYVGGILAVIRGKAWPAKPIEADWTAYDRIALFAPVWADNPPPVVLSALTQLPQGKTVDVKMVSASGKSNCKERLEAAINAVDSVLGELEDIKA